MSKLTIVSVEPRDVFGLSFFEVTFDQDAFDATADIEEGDKGTIPKGKYHLIYAEDALEAWRLVQEQIDKGDIYAL